MQLGDDNGFTVTLSNTANTYIGGTIDPRRHFDHRRRRFARRRSHRNQYPISRQPDVRCGGLPDNVTAAVQADNGIIFNSLSEGNGTLTIGTTAGGYGTSPFTTSRPIAVGNEAATINVNGNIVDA